MSQNNFKLSSQPKNRMGDNWYTWPFDHVEVTSTCYVYQKIGALWWFYMQLLKNAGKFRIWFNQLEANDIDMRLVETMTPQSQGPNNLGGWRGEVCHPLYSIDTNSKKKNKRCLIRILSVPFW